MKFKVSKGNKYNNNEILLKAREIETGKKRPRELLNRLEAEAVHQEAMRSLEGEELS